MPLDRSLVLAAATLLAAASWSPGEVQARPRHREAVAAAPASGVTVDVSHLRSIGLGEYADIVGRAVASELAADGAATPGGGRLVVRLTGLSLSSFAGSDGGGGGGAGGGGAGSGGNFDYLEGEVLVVGPHGEIISQRPQTSSLSATSGGPYYVPGFDQRRAEAVGRAFAAWVRRSL